MDYFKISKILKNWVDILYTDFKVRIQNNGYLSEAVNIEKSVHQGGPMSAILFIATAETLAVSIRADNRIKGVFMRELEQLLNQYADDTDMCLDASNENVIEKVFQHLHNFNKSTGCEVNYDKTTIYRIGSLRDSSAKLYTEKNLSWVENEINVLGNNSRER